MLKSILLLGSFLIFSSSVLADSPPVFASVTYDNDTGTFNIVDGTVDDRVAWGNFTDQISSNGWTLLQIVTNESYPDSSQAYAAGLVEGYLTTDIIYNYWMNTINGYCSDPSDAAYCSRLWNYLNTNKIWSQEMYEALGSIDPYWHQVELMWEQLQGLQDGYQGAFPFNANDSSVLTDFGFLFFQLGGDLEDIEAALLKTSNLKREQGGSCSALVKPLPGNTDIYFSHDSWNTYQSMNRVLKRYEFHYHLLPFQGSPLVPAVNLSMSSYAATLDSLDDFYMLSSGLATMETTIGNNNATLWQYVQYSTNLEWVRCMVANRLATDGPSWSNTFGQHNSGTYNNEWMVLDYNKFTPGSDTLPDNLLWVIEQLPGYIIGSDQTEVLRSQGYWASYNAPFYPVIFDLSGTDELVQQYGDWYSYDKTPRALIFQRDQGSVVDMTTMTKLMRYNDYQNDPLSACNCTPPYSAENTIAARSDLNPADGTYALSAEGHRAHGAIDMKLTNYELFKKLQFVAYGGPTYDQQPPFQWSTFDLADTTPHLGQPDLWKFDPITTTWD